MKATTIFVCFLITQTSASILDDFRGAFVSVENTFGRIISDVVSDVRVTIDCTIYAVEHALSLDGFFRNTSEHEKNCKKETTKSNPPAEVVATRYTPPTAEQKTPLTPSHELNDLPTRIETSIENLNKSINSAIAKSKAYQKVENVQIKLKNETNRLSEVGALLSHKLDTISKKVKKEIKAVDLDNNTSTVEEILSEVKMLHELEATAQNTSEAKEIHHVFDEVLEILHTNTSEGPVSQDKEIKELIESLEKTSNDTFNNIENQYSQWKQGERKHIDDIKEAVMNQKPEDRELPSGFREIFDRLSDATSGKSDRKSSSSSIASSSKYQKSASLDAKLFNKLFELNDDEKADAIKEAKSLMEESKLSEGFVDDIFAHTENSVSIFDNPELWDSSK